VSFILNALTSVWWLNCLVVFAICEIFHQSRNAGQSENEHLVPAYPRVEPFINDLAQFFLNKFKPLIIQSIRDCEADIKETNGLGSFKFVKVEISDMVCDLRLKVSTEINELFL
jgi:hypothetical protein